MVGYSLLKFSVSELGSFHILIWDQFFSREGFVSRGAIARAAEDDLLICLSTSFHVPTSEQRSGELTLRETVRHELSHIISFEIFGLILPERTQGTQNGIIVSEQILDKNSVLGSAFAKLEEIWGPEFTLEFCQELVTALLWPDDSSSRIQRFSSAAQAFNDYQLWDLNVLRPRYGSDLGAFFATVLVINPDEFSDLLLRVCEYSGRRNDEKFPLIGQAMAYTITKFGSSPRSCDRTEKSEAGLNHDAIFTELNKLLNQASIDRLKGLY